MDKIQCNYCGRKFDGKESLHQHTNARHVQQPVERIKPKKVNYKKIGIYFGIGLVVILIAYFGIFYVIKPKSIYVPLRPREEHIKGDANAEVTIVEFSEFECLLCHRFWKETLPKIESQYIDSGEVNLIFKHYPRIKVYEFDWKAAEASECAADQGKFWEYHDILFENQRQLSIDSLKSYANELGLNKTLFNACLDSEAMSDRIFADNKEAVKMRVRSSPTFFINGHRIEGIEPYPAFEQVIDSELQK